MSGWLRHSFISAFLSYYLYSFFILLSIVCFMKSNLFYYLVNNIVPLFIYIGLDKLISYRV